MSTLEKSPADIRFILLMRHAEHTHGQPQPPNPVGPLASKPPFPLTQPGYEQTRAVANRLKEEANERVEKLAVAAIFAAGSLEATATAKVVRRIVCGGEVAHLDLLEPSAAWSKLKHCGAALPKELRNEVSQVTKGLSGGNSVLLVGHQPMLGWLAHALVGEAHPLANSEILCLDLQGKSAPGLLWSISPTDTQALGDLREKIKKKMELATMLGGFITAGIGFLIGMFANTDKARALESQFPMIFLALGCLFLAVVFYLFTMFSYDSLLMPKRFWSETPSGQNLRPRWIVARPPSSAHWVLYQNMIHVWRWQFMPATFLALYGLFLLGSAVVLNYLQCPAYLATYCFWAPVAAPLLVVIAIVFRRARESAFKLKVVWKDLQDCTGPATRLRYLFGPWLGSED